MALGIGVGGLTVGQRVAVNPSRPCGVCHYCQLGQQNHCLDMRFYGSAMRHPHVQGAFQQLIIAEASQCHGVADGVSIEEAAFAEPFAVTLHAVVRAGSLAGKRVLVTGCGPIGTLPVSMLPELASILAVSIEEMIDVPTPTGKRGPQPRLLT